MRFFFKMHVKKIAVFLSIIIASPNIFSATVDNVLDVAAQKGKAAQLSQKKIDNDSAQAKDILAEYRQVMRTVDGLKVYNQKLQMQIGQQEKQLVQIEQSILDVTVIQRQILPQVEKMINILEEFVRLDIPFHPQERSERIGFLRANLDRPDVNIAEKFRQVLEAYKIENEYGRKIDTYSDNIEIEGMKRDVTILRVGRIALLYQTPDMEFSGMWDKQENSWTLLDSPEYAKAIRKGIRMADKQAAIDILMLPVSAPEVQ